MEADILAKGITPESLNWPKYAKNWYFAHGGRLDLETKKLAHGSKLERVIQRFSYANSWLSILDSLRKEQTEYQDMIDIIQG